MVILHSVVSVMDWVICLFCLFLLSFAIFLATHWDWKRLLFSICSTNLLYFFSTFPLLKTHLGAKTSCSWLSLMPTLDRREGVKKKKDDLQTYSPNPRLCSCVFSTLISDGKNEIQPTLNSPGETAWFIRGSQHSSFQAERSDLGSKHLRTGAVSHSVPE